MNTKTKSCKRWLLNTLLFILASYFVSERSITKYMSLHSGIDLGMFENVYWNTLQGDFFQTSLGPFSSFHSYLADHANLTQLLFIPFYWIWSDPRILLVLQAIVLFAPLLLFPWIFKEDENEIFYSVSGTYALFLPLYWIGIFDFHPEVIFIPLFFLFWYFYAKEKYNWMFFVLLVCLWTKEEIAFLFLAFSVLFYSKCRQIAIRIAILSLLQLCISLTLIAWMNPDSFSLVHFSRFQGGWVGLDPIYYSLVFFLFAPLLFLPAFSRLGWILFPYLIYSLLSHSSYNKTPLTHHPFIAVAPLFLATREILVRTKQGAKRRWLSLLLPIVSVVFFFLLGPFAKKFSYNKDIFSGIDNFRKVQKFRDFPKELQIVTNAPEFFSNRQKVWFFRPAQNWPRESLYVWLKPKLDEHHLGSFLENCGGERIEETDLFRIQKCREKE